jgi:hypothetical protein
MRYRRGRRCCRGRRRRHDQPCRTSGAACWTRRGSPPSWSSKPCAGLSTVGPSSSVTGQGRGHPGWSPDDGHRDGPSPGHAHLSRPADPLSRLASVRCRHRRGEARRLGAHGGGYLGRLGARRGAGPAAARRRASRAHEVQCRRGDPSLRSMAVRLRPAAGSRAEGRRADLCARQSGRSSTISSVVMQVSLAGRERPVSPSQRRRRLGGGPRRRRRGWVGPSSLVSKSARRPRSRTALMCSVRIEVVRPSSRS